MKNSLTVRTVNGCVQTEFVTTDGITTFETHRAGLDDSVILKKILDKKFYQHHKGEWIITFPDDHHVITKPTFDALIAAAQAYIFNRDSLPDYTDFC